ncbi:MAG: hypothetical protein Q8N30_02910 [Methylococcales bacterium]|nr:hypothetical protein [Methylococcales bacterium]
MGISSIITPIAAKTITALKVTSPRYQLPDTVFLKLCQIVGDKKTNTLELIPIDKTTFS